MAGAVVDGSPEAVVDVTDMWTFSRTLGSQRSQLAARRHRSRAVAPRARRARRTLVGGGARARYPCGDGASAKPRRERGEPTHVDGRFTRGPANCSRVSPSASPSRRPRPLPRRLPHCPTPPWCPSPTPSSPAGTPTITRQLSRPSAAPARQAAPRRELARVCDIALALGLTGAAAARRFFEQNFDAYRVDKPGFLTGYFEPEIDGARTATARFTASLLGRPADLVQPLPAGQAPELDATLTAARRVGEKLEAFPDRAAIEDRRARPRAPCRSSMSIPSTPSWRTCRAPCASGSPTARVMRLAFAGKNGQPYTSIGRVLTQELNVPPAELTMDKVVAWLRANPAEARRIMQLNRSYIFFRVADELNLDAGPLGAAGVPLTFRPLARRRPRAYGPTACRSFSRRGCPSLTVAERRHGTAHRRAGYRQRHRRAGPRRSLLRQRCASRSEGGAGAPGHATTVLWPKPRSAE